MALARLIQITDTLAAAVKVAVLALDQVDLAAPAELQPEQPEAVASQQLQVLDNMQLALAAHSKACQTISHNMDMALNTASMRPKAVALKVR
jgi:hypothetical protein